MTTWAEAIEAMQFPSLVGKVANTTGAARATITYQFAGNTRPTDLPTSTSLSGWTAFTTAQKNAVRNALATIEEFLNVDFVEVSGAADPTLNIGIVDFGSSNTAGLGGPSWSYTGNTITDWDGFAVFDDDTDLTSNFGINLILHEVMHAMGLDHPFDGNILDTSLDTNHYTVMSYTDDPTGPLALNLVAQVLDVIALQALWGEAAFNTGNTTYTGPRVNGVDVIWDSGGTDVIDASGNGQGVTINLFWGAFSKFSGVEDLVIAYNTNIENVIGGSFADTITGNWWGNTLSGGGAGDTIRGSKGRDTVNGDGGADYVQGGSGRDTVNGGANNDEVRGGRAMDTVSGDGGNDLVKGGGGNDTVLGGAGDDDVRGGRHNDRVDGGTGDDDLTGGRDDDTFVFKTGYDSDTIKDFGVGNDTIEVTGFGSVSTVMGMAAQVGSNVVITFGGGDVLTIENTTLTAVENAMTTF